MKKSYFKLDWMIDLEKKKFSKVHPRVWIKEEKEGYYKTVFQCSMCNLPSDEVSKRLQVNTKIINTCKHCDFTSEYLIRGHDVVIKQVLGVAK